MKKILKAFTLVELLIVTTIISIVWGLSYIWVLNYTDQDLAIKADDFGYYVDDLKTQIINKKASSITMFVSNSKTSVDKNIFWSKSQYVLSFSNTNTCSWRTIEKFYDNVFFPRVNWNWALWLTAFSWLTDNSPTKIVGYEKDSVNFKRMDMDPSINYSWSIMNNNEYYFDLYDNNGECFKMYFYKFDKTKKPSLNIARISSSSWMIDTYYDNLKINIDSNLVISAFSWTWYNNRVSFEDLKIWIWSNKTKKIVEYSFR